MRCWSEEGIPSAGRPPSGGCREGPIGLPATSPQATSLAPLEPIFPAIVALVALLIESPLTIPKGTKLHLPNALDLLPPPRRGRAPKPPIASELIRTNIKPFGGNPFEARAKKGSNFEHVNAISGYPFTLLQQRSVGGGRLSETELSGSREGVPLAGIPPQARSSGPCWPAGDFPTQQTGGRCKDEAPPPFGPFRGGRRKPDRPPRDHPLRRATGGEDPVLRPATTFIFCFGENPFDVCSKGIWDFGQVKKSGEAGARSNCGARTTGLLPIPV
ncbi:hypothetical protein CRG98_037517 [Punica granatum]|uniref:Uncharacterized protein n=1 Tax=Punica granatum TaxID=22663 RepID=A0A2I0IDI6_PUNGR|nr:hypothetical protein CRG98_037517 [Punica granatum]